MKEIIIAYEPVWAISAGLGAGNPCKPDEALKAALFIKKTLNNMFGRFLAENVRIIYGGSVDSSNAADYLSDFQMKGVLVGGASLDGKEFVALLESVNNLAV
jgi:triosephosphate isomerase